MANKVIVEIASKVLVTLGAGAGALLAKAATEKGLGAAIKAIQDKKASDVVATMTEVVTDAATGDVNPSEVVTEAMGTVETVVEKAAETIAEEASGA